MNKSSSKKIRIRKAYQTDLPQIKSILSEWTEPDEVSKYIGRIDKEIKGKTEFNQQFWVILIDGTVVGIGGLADPLPKVIPMARTPKPAEIKILYVDKHFHKQGIGKKLTSFLEKEAIKQGYSELLVRSAKKYQRTGWGFYEHLDYRKRGQIEGSKKASSMQVFRKRLNPRLHR